MHERDTHIHQRITNCCYLVMYFMSKDVCIHVHAAITRAHAHDLVFYAAGTQTVEAQYAWDSMYLPHLLLAGVCNKGPFCHLHCFYWSWTPF